MQGCGFYVCLLRTCSHTSNGMFCMICCFALCNGEPIIVVRGGCNLGTVI